MSESQCCFQNIAPCIGDMIDIDTVRCEIEAVSCVLASFTKYENAVERNQYLRSKLDDIPSLDVYFHYSVQELKDVVSKLQNCENKLLSGMELYY